MSFIPLAIMIAVVWIALFTGQTLGMRYFRRRTKNLVSTGDDALVNKVHRLHRFHRFGYWVFLAATLISAILLSYIDGVVSHFSVFIYAPGVPLLGIAMLVYLIIEAICTRRVGNGFTLRMRAFAIGQSLSVFLVGFCYLFIMAMAVASV